MLITHEQEKAFNAIKYFYFHTMGCDKLKLFKLLFFLDFEHYEKTGRTVTGFSYRAWDHGPVPIELWRDIKYNPEVLEKDFTITAGSNGYNAVCLEPKTEFDGSKFSRREMRLLADISDRFQMMTANEMEQFTHREGTPWDRVFNMEDRRNGEIPFEYQLEDLDDETREVVLELAKDRNAIISHFQ